MQQSLDNLVEQIVGKNDSPLIAEALKRYEVQSDCFLSENKAIAATHQVQAYLKRQSQITPLSEVSLCQRYQLITEHLLSSNIR